MSAAIQLTPLHDARPGMVLSDVLLDPKGNVLLAQGVVLTEAVLASLARHGVESLPIFHAESGTTAPAFDAQAVQARLDYLFRANVRDDHADWATGILRRYVEDYRLQRTVGA
ncbi:hypothetical protein [Massilia sp. 9096]|uniref:hypothetical protein n=1 Tax=Massilia sp. 9096 TaxID=1500894 RepID=UPI00055A74C2|nr:hypothetical protein [Massilia sp. 9096]